MAAQKHNIIGAFERVSFPEFGITDIVAKIDTGAYTGALHCTKINEEEKDGKMVLHFSPFDHPEVVMTTEDYFIRPVKSSNGEEKDRFIIDTQIVIDGETYTTLISLADRSEMKWPVLIGRRFLRSYDLLVDVHRINK